MPDTQKSTIAVIPARGGSQRVPRKNVYTICGKPLLAYTIDVARESGLFERIIVNSDDREVLEIASNFGAEPYSRPPALGNHKAYVIDVLNEMFVGLDIKQDIEVAVMLATSPLRTVEDLQAAYCLFEEGNGKVPVVSVSSYETPIQLAQRIDKNGRMDPFFPDDYIRSTRSTDHNQAYRYNGAIIFNTVAGFMGQHNLIGSGALPYIMPPDRSIDVDWLYQLELIEILLERRTSLLNKTLENSQ